MHGETPLSNLRTELMLMICWDFWLRALDGGHAYTYDSDSVDFFEVAVFLKWCTAPTVLVHVTAHPDRS